MNKIVGNFLNKRFFIIIGNFQDATFSLKEEGRVLFHGKSTGVGFLIWNPV